MHAHWGSAAVLATPLALAVNARELLIATPSMFRMPLSLSNPLVRLKRGANAGIILPLGSGVKTLFSYKSPKFRQFRGHAQNAKTDATKRLRMA